MVKTRITFRNMQSSDAIKSFITNHVERLEKYCRGPIEARVVLGMERHLHRAEIVLSTKGLKAAGVGSTEDMYVSIEDAVDKVEKTLRRHHDKKVKSKSRVKLNTDRASTAG